MIGPSSVILLSAAAEVLFMYSTVSIVNQSNQWSYGIYAGCGSAFTWLSLCLYQSISQAISQSMIQSTNQSTKRFTKSIECLESAELLCCRSDAQSGYMSESSNQLLGQLENGVNNQSSKQASTHSFNQAATRPLMSFFLALFSASRMWLMCMLLHINQSVNQSTNQIIVLYFIFCTICISVNQKINRSISKSVNQSMSSTLALVGTVLFAISQPVSNQPINQSANQSISQPLFIILAAALALTSIQNYFRSQLYTDSVSQPPEQSINRSVDHTVDTSDELPDDQPVSHTENQPINQSKDWLSLSMHVGAWGIVVNFFFAVTLDRLFFTNQSFSPSSSQSINQSITLSFISIVSVIAISNVLTLAALVSNNQSINHSVYLWGLPVAGIVWSFVASVNQSINIIPSHNQSISEILTFSAYLSFLLISCAVLIRLFGDLSKWSSRCWMALIFVSLCLSTPMIIQSINQSTNQSTNQHPEWVPFPHTALSLTGVLGVSDVIPSSIHHPVNSTSIPWRERLHPIATIVSEGSVAYMINTMMLTGYAHSPPLFDALPCISRQSINQSISQSDHKSSNQRCVQSRLNIPQSGNFTVFVTVRSSNGQIASQTSETYSLQSINQVIDPLTKQASISEYAGHMEIMSGLAAKTQMIDNVVKQWCVSDQPLNQSINQSLRCSGDEVAKSIMSMIELVQYRGIARGIELNSQPSHNQSNNPSANQPVDQSNNQTANDYYVLSVQISNGSHITQSFDSDKFTVLSQYELFKQEQRSLSQYLDRITENQSANQTIDQSFNQSNNQSVNQSFNQSINPLKRSLAPFELASLDENSGGQCSSSFHHFVSDYRAWHSRQIARLNAVKHDIQAVKHLLTDDPEPIRVIVSQISPTSGLNDRMVGLMSLFTMAILSRRVLLVDNDWPDMYKFMQPSIQLDLLTAAPFLRHPALVNLTLYQDILQHPEVLNDKIQISDLDKYFTHPISYRASNRGHQIRLLTENPLYSPTLKGLSLTTKTIVGCVYHSFWVLRTGVFHSQPAYDEPTAALLNPHHHTIGIHIRTGMSDFNTSTQSTDPSLDGIKTMLKGGYEVFFHCAHDATDTMQVYNPSVKPVWFLITDDLMLRSTAISRWSSASPKLVTLMLPNSLGHSGFGDASHRLLYLQMALVEHTLFSFTDDHIISSNSGFGRLPAAASLREKPLFVVPIEGVYLDKGPSVVKAQRVSCLSHAQQGVSIEAVSRLGSRL